MRPIDHPAREISARTKDKLLHLLLETTPVDEFSAPQQQPVIDHMKPLDLDVINAIFNMLKDDELLSQYGRTGYVFQIILTGKALEFAKKGGYALQEEILKSRQKRFCPLYIPSYPM